MRITGGIYRGRTVTCPPGIIRPAMDRMRESIFNILGNLQGQSFLDLFTGSGIIALEAASRGASPVHSVEKDGGKKNILRKNLDIAGDTIDLSIMPAERFVQAWKYPFDIIFLDPPFPYQFKADLLTRVAASKLVHKNTRIIIHYPGENKLPDVLAAPRLKGISDIPSFFQRDSQPQPSLSDPSNQPGHPQDSTPEAAEPTADQSTEKIKEPPVTEWQFALEDTREFGRSMVRFYRPQTL